MCTTPPLPSDKGPEAITLINSWIRHCYNDHETCRRTLSGCVVDEVNGPELPSRVVDLGDGKSGRVSLVQGQGRRGNYCALSYCWGTDTQYHVTTTRGNLESHLNGIDIERLPKTCQDAIIITRAVGVRYLWVDALCIIQGDHDDWVKESSRMADVYQNAHLVIAASGASNPGEGCFSPLRRGPTTSIAIPHYDSSGCRNGSISVALTTPGEDSPAFGPLNERGWALQESHLARRTLHFMPSGLSWICRTHETGERYPFDMQQYPQWEHVIQEFSDRELSKYSDRLAALEGLARAICASTGDKYVFGVFESGLPAQLLWMAYGPEQVGKDLVGVPSWSWAAKGGRRLVWTTQNIIQTAVVSRWDIVVGEAGALKVRGPVAECRTAGVIGNESEDEENSEIEGSEASESGDETCSEGRRDAEWSKTAGLARVLGHFRDEQPLERIVSSYGERRTLGVAARDFEEAGVSHMIILAESNWRKLNK